jgi:hypothetical protein
MTTLKKLLHRAFVIPIVIVLNLSLPAVAQTDEFTKAVVGYELTMPKVEAYAAAMEDLVAWSKKNPREAEEFRKNNGVNTLESAIQRIESTTPIKSILDKHKLNSRDFALMPIALLSSIGFLMVERRGEAVPPGHSNAASVAMIRANEARISALANQITSAQRQLRGGR